MEQVEQSTQQVTQALQQSDLAAAAAEQVVAVLAEELEPQEQQVLLEQYLSTGKLPDAEQLKYKMYAVVKDGIVQGYTWEKSDDSDLEYVLMTFENSPAYIKGKYKDGKFYEPEGN